MTIVNSDSNEDDVSSDSVTGVAEPGMPMATGMAAMAVMTKQQEQW